MTNKEYKDSFLKQKLEQLKNTHKNVEIERELPYYKQFYCMLCRKTFKNREERYNIMANYINQYGTLSPTKYEIGKCCTIECAEYIKLLLC